jgi:hypothetical protein
MDDTSATESDIDASSVESNLHFGDNEEDYIINIEDTSIMKNRRTGMARSSSNSSLMSGAASVESSLGSDLLLNDEDLEIDSDEGSENDYTVQVNLSPVKKKKNKSGSLDGSCHSIKDLLIIDAITEDDKELTCSSDEESSESSSGDEFFSDEEDDEDGEDDFYEDTVIALKVGSSHDDRKPRSKNLPKKLDVSSLDNVKITGKRLDSMLDKPVADPLMAKFLSRRRDNTLNNTSNTVDGSISTILKSTDSLDQVFGKGQRVVKTRYQPNCKTKTAPGVHDDPLMKRFLNKSKNSTRGSRDTMLNSIVGSSDSLQHVVGKGKRVVRSLPKALTPVAS